MANPRLFTDYSNITGPEIPVQFDSSVNLPTFGPGGANLSVSTDIGAVVTNVTTSTYNSPSDVLLAGKGTSGNPIWGQIVTAEYDGFGTIQVRGIIKARVNGTAYPSVGGTVAVDGLGNVRTAPGTNAHLFANAVVLGFCLDSNLAQFSHLSGNITVPTTAASGPDVALIQLH